MSYLMRAKDAAPTYTPGPWQTEEYGRSITACRPPGSMVCTARVTLAEIWSGGTASCAEADANARLMAAAPDLLAALQGLLDPATNEDSEWYREARAAARAAVAKATGEPL